MLVAARASTWPCNTCPTTRGSTSACRTRPTSTRRADAEVGSWQRALRRARRPCLFPFAGARRAGGARGGGTLRDAVIDRCARSRRCGMLQDPKGPHQDAFDIAVDGMIERVATSSGGFLQGSTVKPNADGMVTSKCGDHVLLANQSLIRERF
ncbi:hypothetical protein U9M48_025271 [Paspalum notatum var. saurae]|uniref:Uncharacterized protein n=1 Tax=Paspalum notatum var. saurae TaxID=547442 RepID=A0AAQ3TQ56_PASNO